MARCDPGLFCVFVCVCFVPFTVWGHSMARVLKTGQRRFDVPEGLYRLKLVAVVDKPAEGKTFPDGKPMGDGLAWNFAVVGGEYDGKEVGRVTGANPTFGKTQESECYKMLCGLAGRRVG